MTELEREMLEAVRRWEASGRTRYALAKRAGVAQSMLSRFVSGERALSLETAGKLLPLLGLAVVRSEDGAEPAGVPVEALTPKARTPKAGAGSTRAGTRRRKGR